jgi:phosphatidylserine decarboxylase
MLLGRTDIARSFQGGSLLIARLCPLDYHRFHYPDDGRTWDSYRVHGALHSVNPLALKFRSDIFFTNERQISLLDTRNFGRIAYIEVGALCVGKIVQSHFQPEFKRGDEKGYFLFGASTVIVMGQAGAWKPAQDLLEQTAKKRETLVRLGEPLTD